MDLFQINLLKHARQQSSPWPHLLSHRSSKILVDELRYTKDIVSVAAEQSIVTETSS